MMDLVEALGDGRESGYERDDSSGSDETGEFSMKADFGSCSGDDCSISSATNSSASSSFPLSEAFGLNFDDDDDGTPQKIYFLRDKGDVLQRASLLLSEERSLDKLVTQRMLKSGRKEPEAPIWGEAKHMLSLLNRRNIGGPCVSFAPLPPLTTSSSLKRARRAPMSDEQPGKKSRIDTSRVTHVKSSDHRKDANGAAATYEESMWQTDVLRDFNMASEDPDQSTNACNRLSSMPMDSILDSIQRQVQESREEPNAEHRPGVCLEEALLITDKPMLLAKSVAPFSVVHTNGAFMNLSGLRPEALVGKPVESVILSGSSYVNSAMNELQPNKTINASIQDRDCKIRAVPVCAGGEKSVSHLLVTIETDGKLACLAGAFFGNTGEVHSKEGGMRGSSQSVIGTIG